MRAWVGPVARDAGTRVSCTSREAGTVHILATADDGVPQVRLEVDLADAVSYWQPGLNTTRSLPPDWMEASVTSLVEGAPLGALYNAAGEVLLGWAAAEPVVELSVRYGVSEECNTFVIDVAPVLPLDHELELLVRWDGQQVATVVRESAAWMSDQCPGAPLTPLPMTREPVYSTWYAFNQDIDHASVVSAASGAAAAGFGSLFIDDGWQQFGHGRGYQGCGDWLPDRRKFTDLADTVAKVHDEGLAVALWVAPLLLGAEAAVFQGLNRYAPLRSGPLNCAVLDPRFRVVREHVVGTCVRLVRDYGADLLKVDFLDQAMLYRAHPSGGDVDDVGQAMALMLEGVRTGLDALGFSRVPLEFRQPYVSPAISRFGEILRANDCPADSLANRVSTIDARLVSVGQVVHSDPLMWGTSGGAVAVAQQLYASWFAVPQVSMRLDELPDDQHLALTGLLALWRDLVDVSLFGHLTVTGAERGYETVRAVDRNAGLSVLALYSPVVADVPSDATPHLTVLNATAADTVILRLQRHVVDGVIRCPSGKQIGVVAPCGPGLVELMVPPFGSLFLETVPASA